MNDNCHATYGSHVCLLATDHTDPHVCGSPACDFEWPAVEDDK